MKGPCQSIHKPHCINYLRLSITNECDLQCKYCMPYRNTIARVDKPLTLCEISRVVNGFAQNGITKVRLTGGEPLVRRDVADIVKCIAETPGISKIGLTTNGTRLSELAPDLAAAGLNAVNISLDTLNPETFKRISGCNRLDDVLRGIDAALRCGFDEVKINTVVMRGVNDRELAVIASLAKSLPVQVRFIELMPLGHSTDEWRSMYVSADEIQKILGRFKSDVNQGSASVRLLNLPGCAGSVGIISPMSKPFCDACNRVRLTSSGVIKPCLRLPIEYDIRPLISESDFASRLGEVISEMSCHKLSNRSASMSAIQFEAMSMVGG